MGRQTERPVQKPAATAIPRAEYLRRRRHFMAMMEPGSIAIIPSARELTRSRDTEFPFRQDSDFFYLSGFNEPDAVMVLVPGREHGEFVMFCRERDPEKELWHGYRQGPEGVCAHYGADDAFPVGDIDDILPGLIEGRQRVYYSMGRSADFDRQVMVWVNQIRAREASGAVPPGELTDLDHMLHELRLIKSAAELRVMRRAGEITARAHSRAMRFCQPGHYEYQLEAEILHEFAMAGARHPAYPSIVGSGANGCILHYVDNSAKMKRGDLVLIDAGCELEGYAADVTRTFPVGGRFSRQQKALYEVVLAAQQAAFEAIRPGNHWNQPHDETVRVITEGLVRLGLLKGRVSTLIERGAYRDFYMHRAGHWLGLDVHDVGDYRVGGAWRLLEPGMVMTVEPGIYVAPDNHKVEPRWRGIGIRIEDNVAVTADGYEVLTEGVPRSVAEVEALMAAG
ncbi:Xaa-Pro aminopeptidase [Parahaliea aestuarii]|uniref:Xaa-Pro aminopeptidase n=1 Tax=Parahaliea aestuarii TaxID=1852021 RepID=A0A5C8ZXM7_9GAMM|nr:Xaa-Pro aminopeptidase [Parahaliea aestuarii]TXS92589.1 Xaa-Pro aminopeptidase [Parahaliea aestuarii]